MWPLRKNCHHGVKLPNLNWLYAFLRPEKKGTSDILPPRFRKGAPWLVAAAILVVLGIVFSEITGHGLVLLFVIPAAFLIQRGRRHMAPRANEAKQADDRPPTLILRSFQDDRIATERFSLVLKRTFEQTVAAVLRTEGPPIIVGDPSEDLPRLGAFRAYFDHHDWQIAVTRLMDEVALLVFILGDTENLLWEFRQAVGKGRQTDILVIMPPLGRQILQSRWQRFTKENASLLGGHAPPGYPYDTVLGLFFLEGDPVFIVSRKRSLAEFRLCIRVFLSLHRKKITSIEGLKRFMRDNLPAIRISCTEN